MLPTQWEDPVMSLSTITSPSQYSLGPILSNVLAPFDSASIAIHLTDRPQVPHRDHQRAGHQCAIWPPEQNSSGSFLARMNVLCLPIQDVTLVGQFVDRHTPGSHQMSCEACL